MCFTVRYDNCTKLFVLDFLVVRIVRSCCIIILRGFILNLTFCAKRREEELFMPCFIFQPSTIVSLQSRNYLSYAQTASVPTRTYCLEQRTLHHAWSNNSCPHTTQPWPSFSRNRSSPGSRRPPSPNPSQISQNSGGSSLHFQRSFITP